MECTQCGKYFTGGSGTICMRCEKEIVRLSSAINLSKPVKRIDRKSDRLRYELIPQESLAELARAYTIGAEKHSSRDWEQGLSFGLCFGKMIGHAYKYLIERYDKDGLHHLAAVAFWAFALITFEKRKIGTNDLYKIDFVSRETIEQYKPKN